jgi:hypothetical protein
VRRTRIINVTKAVVGLMVSSASVAPLIMWINRWPAVMLAIS